MQWVIRARPHTQCERSRDDRDQRDAHFVGRHQHWGEGFPTDLLAESQALLVRTNRVGKSSHGTALPDGVILTVRFRATNGSQSPTLP